MKDEKYVLTITNDLQIAIFRNYLCDYAFEDPEQARPPAHSSLDHDQATTKNAIPTPPAPHSKTINLVISLSVFRARHRNAIAFTVP